MIEQGFSYALVVIGIFGLLNCPDRSDFNLPLGLFAFLLWNHRPYFQRHKILYLLFFSIFVDLIWLLDISIGLWGQNVGNSLRPFTQLISILNLVYKGVLIVYAVLSFEDCRTMFTTQGFQQHFLGSSRYKVDY